MTRPVIIAAVDAFIGDRLAALAAIDPCMAAIESIHVDQHVVAAGAPVPNMLSSGAEEAYLIEPGFCLQFAEGEIGRDWRLTTRTAENCLRLRIPFAGTSYHGTSRELVSDLGSRCTYIVQPAGDSLTGVFNAGAVYRFCALHLSERFLVEQLGLPVAEWPRPLAATWQRSETMFGRIELGKLPLATAARLFNLGSRGAWRMVEVRAIALDLLRQLFEAWNDDHATADSQIRLRPSERDQLHKLRAAADSRSPQPIGMAEAIALTGLNKNKIHVGFKRIFGLSLHDYCFDLRMQLARRLLIGSAMSVAEVAASAGFSEPANFSAAFRRHFSILPSNARLPGNILGRGALPGLP
jgi:AraC-like DNA-binding protein